MSLYLCCSSHWYYDHPPCVMFELRLKRRLGIQTTNPEKGLQLLNGATHQKKRSLKELI